MPDVMENLLQSFQDPAHTGNPYYDLGAQLAKKRNWDKAAKSIYDAVTPDDAGDGSVKAHPLGDKDAFNALSRDQRIEKAKSYIEKAVITNHQRQSDAEANYKNANSLHLLAAIKEMRDKAEGDSKVMTQLPSLAQLLQGGGGGSASPVDMERAILTGGQPPAPMEDTEDARTKRLLGAVEQYPEAAQKNGVLAAVVKAIAQRKDQFKPTGSMVSIPGSDIQVPAVTSSGGGAKILDDLVAGNQKYASRVKQNVDKPPGEPQYSADGKMYWDSHYGAWKPITATGAKMEKPNKFAELLKGAAAAVAPATTTPLAMPKTKTDLVKGKAYSTPRGVATWDGEKFVTQ